MAAMDESLKRHLREYLQQNLRVEVSTDCLSSMNNIKVTLFLEDFDISSDETYIVPQN